MKHNHYAPGRVNPHLPHDGIEIEPAPADAEVAQRDADLLVSQLMKTNTKPSGPAPTSRDPWRDATPAQTDVDKYPQKVMATAEAMMVDATPVVPKEAVEFRDDADVTQDLRASFPKLSDEAIAQENKGKPGFFDRVPPIYVAVAVGIVLAIYAPKLLFWMLLGAVVFVLTAAVLLKAPGISTLSFWAWNRFVDRNPDRAERVRKVADSVALSLEYILDRLPGSLADKLALPDFSQPVSRKR